MASDTMRMLKAAARAIVGIAAGALFFYNTESPAYGEDSVGWRLGLSFVAALVVFFLLSSLGKSSD